jgi:hypothetical protein
LFVFGYGWEKRRLSVKGGIFQWVPEVYTTNIPPCLTELIDFGFRGGPVLFGESEMTSDDQRGSEHHDA